MCALFQDAMAIGNVEAQTKLKRKHRFWPISMNLDVNVSITLRVNMTDCCAFGREYSNDFTCRLFVSFVSVSRWMNKLKTVEWFKTVSKAHYVYLWFDTDTEWRIFCHIMNYLVTGTFFKGSKFFFFVFWPSASSTVGGM